MMKQGLGRWCARGLFFCGLWSLAACGSPKRNLGFDDGVSGDSSGGAAGTLGSAGKGSGRGGSKSSPSASGDSGDSGDSGGSSSGNSSSGGGAVLTNGGDSSSGATSGAASSPGGADAGGMSSVPPAGCTAAATRSCGDDGALGTCAFGKETCGADGKWSACSILPLKDSCVVGNDDSCNGAANEGCGCVEGKPSACAGAKGNCASGTQTCTGGVLAACSIKAAAKDTCTPGDDSNCNGTPNEGCTCTNGATQACGPSKVGKCQPGTSTCVNGAYGACMNFVDKANRDCRSKDDNNCDGIADNTIDTVCTCAPGTTSQASCGHSGGVDGKGMCHAGTATCVTSADFSSSYWGSCTGGVGPAKRNCASGADNDCNGTVDNLDSTCACKPGATQSCQSTGKGKCQPGTQTCNASSDGTSSAWGTCTSSVKPVARDCTSSSDNDCDGTPDNTVSGPCQCNATSCATGSSCKIAASASSCVTCTANSDCSNGGTCASNACQCKTGYNGNRCQYQIFQAIAQANGDGYGEVRNISHDGSTVVGYVGSGDGSIVNAWRFLNGGSNVNYITSPANETVCAADAVDSNGVIYGDCRSSSFKYVNGATSLLSFSTDLISLADASRDGKVLVGTDGFQGFLQVGTSAPTLIPLLSSDDNAYGMATNADGSIVVGYEVQGADEVAFYWTQKLGTSQLPRNSSIGDYYAYDVSADGTVIVGVSFVNQLAVKWSGSKFSVIETTPGTYEGVSGDGKVLVGFTGDGLNGVATVWNSSGAHPISSFVDGATLSGWTLYEAKAISDDGKWVAGNGLHNSIYAAWLVHLP